MPPPVDRSELPAEALALQAMGEGLLALARQQGLPVGLKDAVDGRYVHINAPLAALLGMAPAEAVGRTDADGFDASLAQALRTADQTAVARDSVQVGEHRFELRGERREFNVLRVPCALGGRRLLCCVWQDLVPQRQRDAQMKSALEQIEREQKASQALRRELADQGLRDAATGLYTPSHFEDQLRREVDLSNREHREFALVYIALDEFSDRVRQIGDRAQERIHEAMGRLLRGNTRAMDASCRIDDRHFAVLLSGVGLATAHSRMEGLRRQVATQLIVVDGQDLGFTVSMGVASFPHTAHSQDEVVQACQSALAEARRRGGNAVALAAIRFDPVK
ncbi:sensor domain-containing diguanylate cyclase [Ideonella sp. A 288]|uniref:GGDEF domain-containing protein n=1 Tax=Ideonella sp. A 288 TaxID=1962181 RepID=UPI001F3067A9|nr:sensor domain-containing diguanylate cyclase [Ideonella sp. A 288]